MILIFVCLLVRDFIDRIDWSRVSCSSFSGRDPCWWWRIWFLVVFFNFSLVPWFFGFCFIFEIWFWFWFIFRFWTLIFFIIFRLIFQFLIRFFFVLVRFFDFQLDFSFWFDFSKSTFGCATIFRYCTLIFDYFAWYFSFLKATCAPVFDRFAKSNRLLIDWRQI